MSILMFFFFKQKTAYEMRISDWSSDVCSSDLDAQQRQRLAVTVATAIIVPAALFEDDDLFAARLGDDLGRHGQALGVLCLAAIAGQQNIAQRHGVACFTLDLLDGDLVAGGDAILFADRKSTRLNSRH